jgi:hypothetical protein
MADCMSLTRSSGISVDSVPLELKHSGGLPISTLQHTVSAPARLSLQLARARSGPYMSHNHAFQTPCSYDEHLLPHNITIISTNTNVTPASPENQTYLICFGHLRVASSTLNTLDACPVARRQLPNPLRNVFMLSSSHHPALRQYYHAYCTT